MNEPLTIEASLLRALHAFRSAWLDANNRRFSAIDLKLRIKSVVQFDCCPLNNFFWLTNSYVRSSSCSHMGRSSADHVLRAPYEKPGPFSRRKAVGVVPVNLRNTRFSWDASLNPTASATSAIDRSPFSQRCQRAAW